MKKHVVQNSSDEAQISKAADWQEDRDRDLDQILQSKRGRRWLHHLIYEVCHADQRSHVPGDTESTAFNEGARSVGLALVEEIKMRDYAKFVAMLEEAEAE